MSVLHPPMREPMKSPMLSGGSGPGPEFLAEYIVTPGTDGTFIGWKDTGIGTIDTNVFLDSTLKQIAQATAISAEGTRYSVSFTVYENYVSSLQGKKVFVNDVLIGTTTAASFPFPPITTLVTVTGSTSIVPLFIQGVPVKVSIEK